MFLNKLLSSDDIESRLFLDARENEIFQQAIQRCYTETLLIPKVLIDQEKDIDGGGSAAEKSKDTIRREAVRQGERVSRSDLFGRRWIADRPFLYVARQVGTHLGIEYFSLLKDYLNQQVGEASEVMNLPALMRASALLLRHLEALIPELKPPRNRFKSTDSTQATICKYLHRDMVEARSKFDGLPEYSRGNHFNGKTASGTILGDPHNPYDGLSVSDILLYLNSAEDVELYRGESLRDENKIATIRTDGRIDLIRR